MGELVSRYRDMPFKAVANRYAVFYIGLNAVASALALLAILSLSIDFGMGAGNASTKQGLVQMVQVLVAGFGAMAVFRSSAFVARIGDQDVGIGPSAFLNILLGSTDRAVDRHRAKARAECVAKSMKDVSFLQTNVALPTLALALMQNLPKEEGEKLAAELDSLRKDETLSDGTKSLCMGLALMNAVGEGVLTAAIDAVKTTLEADADPALLAAMQQAKNLQDAKGGAPSSSAAAPEVINFLVQAVGALPPPKKEEDRKALKVVVETAKEVAEQLRKPKPPPAE
ncbi:hypothetical protein KRR26_35930 [Corallococcus sp. M34]|uniref:hypothetical protein n=1 Tax=Citreicoccus inhibens TaxID=2849499 RepID=UPI001C22C09D|nr:hypothetical protein [Citreicoccus inhibens]MBU8900999.1 hypothetical protein [Citreicoccus inhibens]